MQLLKIAILAVFGASYAKTPQNMAFFMALFTYSYFLIAVIIIFNSSHKPLYNLFNSS